jgi:hypothetical protein
MSSACDHAAMEGAPTLDSKPRVIAVGRRRRTVVVGAAAVVFTLAAIVVLVYVHSAQGTERYPLTAARVSATLYSATQDQADALMPEHNAPVAAAGGELMAGTVTWAPPRDAPNTVITLFLIDKRSGDQPIYWTATSDRVTIGNGPYDDVIADRYSWLSMVRAQPVADGWTDYSSDLTAPASLGQMTFIAYFPPPSEVTVNAAHYSLAPIEPNDLMLAVVCHDGDGNGGWAERAIN